MVAAVVAVAAMALPQETPMVSMAVVAAATVEKVEMLLVVAEEVAVMVPTETGEAEITVPEELPLVVLAVAMAATEL